MEASVGFVSSSLSFGYIYHETCGPSIREGLSIAPLCFRDELAGTATASEGSGPGRRSGSPPCGIARGGDTIRHAPRRSGRTTTRLLPFGRRDRHRRSPAYIPRGAGAPPDGQGLPPPSPAAIPRGFWSIPGPQRSGDPRSAERRVGEEQTCGE